MCERLTLERAKALQYGDMLHETVGKNADGTPRRWCVSGRPKVWKTRPDEVRVPIKHGLYTHDALTHENLHDLCVGSGESCEGHDPVPFGEW